MKTRAAILTELGKPLELVDLEIPALGPGQTLVEVAYSGICHTQILECRGYRGADSFLPHCLGHEGSGRVMEIGSGVTKVKPGDNVILSWIKGSGADIPGAIYNWNGKKVNAGGITTFSRHSIISENRLTLVPNGVSLKVAALMGCAVPTGLGCVINTLSAKPEQSIVVFGAGGIGLCSVAGAKICGCNPIIAVDIRKNKLETAMKMGAHTTIDASKEDPVKKLLDLKKDGYDLSVEATGNPSVMIQTLKILRSRGGAAVIVGNAHYGKILEIDPKYFNQGKRLMGTWGGDNLPERDFPRYLQLIMSGKLDLGPLVEEEYPLREIDHALNDLEFGRVIRPIINMDLE